MCLILHRTSVLEDILLNYKMITTKIKENAEDLYMTIGIKLLQLPKDLKIIFGGIIQ